VRQMEHDGELIWLRQSATFSVNGQTRTVEIAVPVRPDASAEEVEALISQANMGMDALTRELDARVAALLAGEAQHAAVTNVTEAAQTHSAPPRLSHRPQPPPRRQPSSLPAPGQPARHRQHQPPLHPHPLPRRPAGPRRRHPLARSPHRQPHSNPHRRGQARAVHCAHSRRRKPHQLQPRRRRRQPQRQRDPTSRAPNSSRRQRRWG